MISLGKFYIYMYIYSCYQQLCVFVYKVLYPISGLLCICSICFSFSDVIPIHIIHSLNYSTNISGKNPPHSQFSNYSPISKITITPKDDFLFLSLITTEFIYGICLSFGMNPPSGTLVVPFGKFL